MPESAELSASCNMCNFVQRMSCDLCHDKFGRPTSQPISQPSKKKKEKPSLGLAFCKFCSFEQELSKSRLSNFA